MYYPTIRAHFNISLPNNSVALLTINESSYIMTIIKLNNMTYHYLINLLNKNKNMNFLHSGVGFGYEFGVGTYIPITRPVPVFLNQGKPKTSQIGVGLGGYP